MLEDSRVVYLFVYVSDLLKSREFYENKMGLRVIEADSACVKFDAGQVILALNRAEDYGIALPKNKDNSADIVFLVEKLDEMKEALASRGIAFSKTDWYQPGGITDFYDPDGHWLTLYQPNEEAMKWPSGDRIRAVLRARQNRNSSKASSASTSQAKPIETNTRSGLGLDGSNLFYVFFFVKDPTAATVFYHNDLGLRDLEGGPCSSGSGGDSDGVVKYDTGGILLTTHRIYEERTQDQVDEHVCPPRDLNEGSMRSVAPAFYVRNVDSALRKLSEKRPVPQPTVSRSAIGVVASLEDPGGHLLFLYEPSEQALGSPSGTKIQEILATPL
jgi:catechol 2,3-dioxygenase-like lactoylglutathione lyase family enzyme